MRKKEINSLLVFKIQCLRAILRVTMSDRIGNIVIRRRYMINASYKLNFTNPTPRGRPLKRWSDGIIENSGVPLSTLERRVADREAYKKKVYMCSARGRQVQRN